MASDQRADLEIPIGLATLFLDCFDREIIPEYENQTLLKWEEARRILEQYYADRGRPSGEAQQFALYFYRQIAQHPDTMSPRYVAIENKLKEYVANENSLSIAQLKRLFEQEFRRHLFWIARNSEDRFEMQNKTKNDRQKSSTSASRKSLQSRKRRSKRTAANLKIGVLWCTFFQRRSFLSRPLQLRDAYRPPSLFASKMRDKGYVVEFLVCDDILQRSDLDGSVRKLQDEVDILYVMTHGTFSSSGYDVYLHGANWLPGTTGIGQAKLSVAVFDTCKLIDSSVSNWKAAWAKATLGPNLRLLLGFDGPAVIDRGSAERGKAFANNLINGNTFADSWIQAVHGTTTSQYSKAVAIGIGDTVADAQLVLNTACLASMPSARKTSSISLQERY